MNTEGLCTNRLYRDFSDFLKAGFPFKVQKISINRGSTCPNRDGTKGRGGCTYCNNQAFSPSYCMEGESVEIQVRKGIDFFAQKYATTKYLAYFQSYTNTYGDQDALIKDYEEALKDPNVVGLIVGTRPDCMPDALLDYFESLSEQHRFVFIEYGIETTDDCSLERINRGHTYEDSVQAVERTAERGLKCGAHMILGLPGEDRNQILVNAEKISQLPLTSVKLHQLQIIKGTEMAKQYLEKPELFHIFELDEYIDLCISFIERLNPDFYIDRFVSQSPENMKIAPRWGLKNYRITNLLNKRMEERETYQGMRIKQRKIDYE